MHPTFEGYPKNKSFIPMTVEEVIPIFDIGSDNQRIKAAYFEKLSELYDKGQFTAGHGVGSVEALEEIWSRYCSRRYALAVGSGTHALHLAAHGLGLKSGDEVIVPANTFAATALAPAATGAKIIACDVDAQTWNLSRRTVSDALTKNTKAIFAVNLYGNPAPYEELRDFGIPIVEDAAHSHGASYRGHMSGSAAGGGDYAAFSFFPTKVFGGIGDSGMLLLDDESAVDTLKAFRNCGQAKPHYATQIGSVYRMHAIQALFLLEKWRIFDDIVAHRRRLAAVYDACFASTPVIPQRIDAQDLSAYFAYVVRVPRREKTMEALLEKKIQTSVQYLHLLDEQPVWDKIAARSASVPNARSLSREILSLPMNSKVTTEGAVRVAETLLANL